MGGAGRSAQVLLVALKILLVSGFYLRTNSGLIFSKELGGAQYRHPKSLIRIIGTPTKGTLILGNLQVIGVAGRI